LIIADGDDKPIQIDGVVVRYYADEIVFEGNAGEDYTLEFGDNSIKTAPVYDIERYKEEILKGRIDRASIGVISYAEINEAPPEREYRFIFNILIVAVALLLGTVIIFRLRKKQ